MYSPKKSNIAIERLLCVLSAALINVSCSSDETMDTVNEGSEIFEEQNQVENENMEERDDEPNSGEIIFEEQLVLEENRTFVNYILSQSDYAKFIAGEGDIKKVSNKIYEHLNDDFDFIVILSVEESQSEDLFYGRSHPVQNQIEGLGIGAYDNTMEYGSSGRLKSVTYMPRTEYIRNGPFLHEIAHTWANKGIIPTTVGGHWGFANTAGQLGGFDELIDMGNGTYKGRLNGEDGFGTFANGGNSVPYGNLEMYLMGLIGSNELQTVRVATNPQFGNSVGEFTADAIETYTANDLISNHGERVPSVLDSQKVFKALTVVISTSTIDDEKSEAIRIDLENFSRASMPDTNWGSLNNFWMATQGKASFDFDVLQESIK